MLCVHHFHQGKWGLGVLEYFLIFGPQCCSSAQCSGSIGAGLVMWEAEKNILGKAPFFLSVLGVIELLLLHTNGISRRQSPLL